VVQFVYALLSHQAMHYETGKAGEHSRKADWMFVKFMTLTRRKRHNRFPPGYRAIPRVALQPFHGYDDSRGCLVRGSICFALRISYEYARNKNLSFPLSLSSLRSVPSMSRACPIFILIILNTESRPFVKSLAFHL